MGEADINLETLIEDLEQQKYALQRELELATLRIDTLDEEMQLEVELAQEEDDQDEEDIQRMNKELMLLNNKEFTDAKLNLDTSLFNQSVSTSYLNASSVNISSVMEASIHEPDEITDLTNELKETEMKLRDAKCSLEENQHLLQEIKNQNLITENNLKNSRQECQSLKEDLNELEEDIILINSEMSLLPRLKQSDAKHSAKENSIYDELVRRLEVTKTDLDEKKRRLSNYVRVMHQIETECKQIEGEILVLDVYDREDETRKLQSQANLLEAYKHMHKELEKNIQILQTSMTDLPALIHSNSGHNPDLMLKTVSQYHDFINVKLKKLNHELTYHKMELVSVTDKETQLSTNVGLLKLEADKLSSECNSLGNQIEDIKRGRRKAPSQAEKNQSRGPAKDQKDGAKEVKPKTVRFQTSSPSKSMIETTEKEEEDKENDTSVVNQSEDNKLKPVEPQKIVIHKRK
uniref:Uncharacterized protein n=1 Tax=Cacopsylla melanoneura TaxID=428564 RepID=A0A8D9ERG3_9HEMI